MLNRIVYLLMTILLQQRIYIYSYLLQLNKTTFSFTMYNQRLAPLSNYTLFNLCYALRACADRQQAME